MPTRDTGGDTNSFGKLPPSEFPPRAATTQINFGAHSRGGPFRAVNSDHYLIVRLGRHHETLMSSLPDGVLPPRYDEFGYAIIVADGLGESVSGEVASRIAIATLMRLVSYFGKWNLRIDDDAIARDIMDRAERFYRHVDSAVTLESLGDPSQRLQTTLTAAFGAGTDLFFAHVGHSRAYLLREGVLHRLTRDHTLGTQRSTNVPLAPLVDVSAAARDLKHILTEAIGMGGSIGPSIDLEHCQLSNNDRVLVCTNGLTDAVNEKVIEEVLLSDQPPDEQSRTLVDLAIASGGADDVTALVAQYRLPEEKRR